jgi:ankyrin repeat protein
LDDIYEEAMKRIELQSADNRNLALRLLSWIVHAFRPLRLTEIQHAMAIDDLEPEDRLVSHDSLTPQDILVDVCAGMLRVDEKSGIVRLIHYTTQKYFEGNGSDHFPRAHYDIGVRCMKYLSLNAFGEGYCLTDELYERRLEENPLLDYAVKNGMNHIHEDAQDAALGLLLDDVKLSSSSQVLLVGGDKYDGYSQHFPRKKFHGVHFTAYLGLKDIMIKLLSENSKVNPDAKDDYGRTPLWWAAVEGHTAVVEALLATGMVELDAKDNRGQTPLSWAAYGGHTAVVEMLLATGKVEPDSKDGFGQTPLWWAAARGHTAVVEALLATGKVNPDAKDDSGRTPLWWAAAEGHTAVVETLLATGKVEPDAKDRDGRTPLWWAAAEGYTAVVETLLATGKVEPDSKDGYGLTPLSQAAAEGHTAVVKTLLATDKVELDAKDSDGWMPLSWAALGGRTAVVETLLATGMN